MNEQLPRIARFLSQYIERDDGSPQIPETPEFLKAAITVLLREQIFTPDQLRMEALREMNVVVPWELFPDDVQAEVLR